MRVHAYCPSLARRLTTSHTPANPTQLLLAPWACSVDRAQTFPKFLELSGKVQRCFGAGKGSVEEVVEALKADGSSWAEECLANMDAASPLRCGKGFACMYVWVCGCVHCIHTHMPSHHHH